MSKPIDALRILLLQIRDDARVRAEELGSFIDYSGVRSDQIDVLNVFDTPQFEPSVIDGYDALYVGGASEASVLEPETYTFLQPGYALLRHCIDNSIPTFASCFGFQMAVMALGGEVLHQEEDFEMGTLHIRMESSAEEDPFLYDVPDGFLAVSVHQQKALQPPPGCVQLGYTEQCCHIFRVKDRPFWAFQFHPEVDRNRLIERLTIYKSKYTNDDAHLDEVLSAAEETPESNILMRKFVERVAVRDWTVTRK